MPKHGGHNMHSAILFAVLTALVSWKGRGDTVLAGENFGPFAISLLPFAA
jgi:hypothetical protein